MRCPEKTIWKVRKIKAASMAARRACRSLSLDPQRDLTRVGGMLRIKASCAMSEGRSSRGTRSGLSKSAERIPSGDESGKPRVAIRHERREATPIGSRLDCRRFRSFDGGWRHAAGKSMCRQAFSLAQPRLAAPGIATETKTALSCEFPRLKPFRPVSLACRPGCSLAYFQPSRVRPGRFPRYAIRSIK